MNEEQKILKRLNFWIDIMNLALDGNDFEGSDRASDAIENCLNALDALKKEAV